MGSKKEIPPKRVGPKKLSTEYRVLGTNFYPFTLIFENDSTARLGVGRPIDSAGRYEVKVMKSSSMLFTCGGRLVVP